MRLPSEALVVLACAALLGPGCNKGPARDALGELEQSLAAARPEIEEYAPASLAGIDDALRDARARLGEGRYTDALRIAQDVPARIDAARAAAASGKQALLAEWPLLASGLQLRSAAIASRLADLVAAASLPKGFDPDRLATARAGAAALDRLSGDAVAAAQAGEAAKALRLGRAALAQADGLAASLGVGVISLPTPGPSPSPR